MHLELSVLTLDHDVRLFTGLEQSANEVSMNIRTRYRIKAYSRTPSAEFVAAAMVDLVCGYVERNRRNDSGKREERLRQSPKGQEGYRERH